MSGIGEFCSYLVDMVHLSSSELVVAIQKYNFSSLRTICDFSHRGFWYVNVQTRNWHVLGFSRGH